MDVPANLFKRSLREGKLQFGLWLGLADAYCAEIAAGAGFDWLLIDGEHAPNDVRSVLAQLQAIAAYPVQPIVRTVIGDTPLIKQILDVGAQTILVPLVDSAEQAEALVRAIRYPPRGVRGVGAALARASRWNRIGDYVHRAEAELCLLVQIETVKGLENLEAIAQVEGVDGLFIGPSDLSASLGHLGAPSHPEVQRAVGDAIARIRALGKAPGVLAYEPAVVRSYIDRGALFVAVGADVTVLARGTTALADSYREKS